MVFLFTVMPFIQGMLAVFTRHIARSDIHQHQVIVCSTTYQAEPIACHTVGQRFGISDHLLLVMFECRLSCLSKTDSLGGNDIRISGP